ncbi:hypothetical protein GRX03_03030 [Halovenus sp. WSH3]|uniref:DUF7979 domain-containing protein n=1 Tax=Halovenus carboxidivorans TaxID=2692199 RepID=A0A6B0T4X5_9EURY|nr:hypothetical protein [Halovenus carboxidivorans]MXR50583.1 hypothetical protein [Halovenus carboxidivorans]
MQSGITVGTFTKTLLILTVLTGSVTIVGIEVLQWNADTVEYSIETLSQSCDPQSDSRYVLEYSNLSATDQEIFRSALRADDVYTTRTPPDDFLVQTDTTEDNYVRYDSECYRLTAQSRRENPLFEAFLLRTVGGVLTGVFTVAAVIGLAWTTIRRRGDDP